MAVVAQLSGATVQRNGRRILDGVDLAVLPGQRWAVLGPNGCGKTTMLSLLGALQHPTSGTVDVLDRRLGAVDVQRELWPRIGHVQGRHRPAGRLSAEQVVLTGWTGTNALPLRWHPDATTSERSRYAMRAMGVEDLASRSWASLSNGEQRRTLVARALVRTPDLLLLDEPAAGLDLPAREHLVDALDAVAGQPSPLAWVLVSHHVEELPISTTHVVLMREGRIVARGDAEQVLQDGPMSAAFDLPLSVARRRDRWSVARR